MEIRYQLTNEDMRNALRAAPRSVWGSFQFRTWLTLLFLVGMGLIELGFSTAGWIWLVASFGLGMAAYEVPRYRVRRALRENPSAQGEIVADVNNEGVLVIFATGRTQMGWPAFIKSRETAALFLLFTSPYKSIFIPKRVLSQEQIEELRSLLKANIPGQ